MAGIEFDSRPDPENWSKMNASIPGCAPVPFSVPPQVPVLRISPPEETRTPCNEHGIRDHRPPNHISKIVPSTAHPGTLMRTRTRRQNLDAVAVADNRDSPMLHGTWAPVVDWHPVRTTSCPAYDCLRVCWEVDFVSANLYRTGYVVSGLNDRIAVSRLVPGKVD